MRGWQCALAGHERGVICTAENSQTWDSVSAQVLGAKILENQHVRLRKISKSDFSLDLIKRICKHISVIVLPLMVGWFWTWTDTPSLEGAFFFKKDTFRSPYFPFKSEN